MLRKSGWVFVVSTDLVSHLCVNRENKPDVKFTFSQNQKRLLIFGLSSCEVFEQHVKPHITCDIIYMCAHPQTRVGEVGFHFTFEWS